MTRASIIRYSLLLAVPLAAAVIARGGRAPLEWNLSVAVIGAISLGYWIRRGAAIQAPPPDRRLAALALLAPAYVAFQMLPLPLPLLRLLSPRRAEIAEKVGTVMPGSWFAPLSIEPAATAALLMTLIACVICLLLVRDLTWLSLRRGSWVTILPLIAIGVFEGAFALWEAWTGDVVDGTYLNRNHLAGLLEMVLPLSVAYALDARRRDKYARPGSMARGMVRSLLLGVALPMMSVAIIFVGVLASASKMGYVASLFGLFAMGVAAVLTRLSGIAKWVSIAALPVIAIAGFVLFANQDVLTRLAGVLDSADGLSGEGRIPIWTDSLSLFAANPLFGSGLGTYATAFLGFQTSGVAFHWTHAHNDYLELATDLGIIGFAVFGALMLAVVGRAVHAARPAREGGSDLVALGCLGAFAAIGLHSFVDFNLTVPANLLLLSWIAGIAAGIPLQSQIGAAKATPYVPSERRPDVQGVRRAWLQPRQFERFAVIGLACVAFVMASTRIMAGTPSEAPGPPTLDQRLDGLRKSPASPYRWLELGEAFAASGQTAQVKASVSNALALGADVPPVIRRSATLLDALGDRRYAVTLVFRGLRHTGDDNGETFDWFTERRIPAEDVLAGLATDRRALQSYLRYLMLPGTCREAALAWRQLVTRHRPDGQLASDYVSFLFSDCERSGAAAQAWADYARKSAPDYLVSNWVFNGGFEQDPSSVPFDWQWNRRNAEAEATIDAGQAFTGKRSLRMVFRGARHAYYEGARQNISVSPGIYRLSAALRTLDLDDVDGIRLRISGSGSGPRLDIWTQQATGTTEWHTISTEVVIPEGMSLLRIQVVRRPGAGAKNEGSVSGTAWVDAVTLSRVGSTSR